MPAPKGDKQGFSEERPHILAFLRDANDEQVVKEAVGRLLSPYSVVKKGGLKAAIKHLSSHRSPKHLIVDITDSDLPLTDMGALADVCEPGVEVVAIGGKNDVGLFRDLLFLGISDYILKPITVELIHKALSSLSDEQSEETPREKKGRVISFMGVRGGLGTTTLATRAAWILSEEQKRRTVLVDLDLHLGTVGLILDLDVKHNLREALEDPKRVDTTFIESSLEKVSNKLHVLNAEEGVDDHFFYDESAIVSLIEKLKDQFHYVIIDLPHRVSNVNNTVLQMSRAISLVADMSLPSMRDTVRFCSTLSTHKSEDQIYVVCSQTSPKAASWLPLDEFEKNLGRKFDHHIGYDEKIAKSTSYGKADLSAKTPSIEAVRKLTFDLAGWGKQTLKSERSMLGRLFGG